MSATVRPIVRPMAAPVARGVHSRFGEDDVPLTNAVFFSRDGSVDLIGLSVTDYLSVRSELRSIFFIDESTLRDTTDAVTLALASEYLNNGWELCGNADKGVALYVEGTDVSILTRAYRYFGETFA